MRLLGIMIEEFRSIYGQQLPADGLVVLFDPNSAGKTFVLEAAGELLRAASSNRTDPGTPEEVWATGSVRFTLPGAGISGSPDAELYRALLNGKYAGGRAWEGLAPEAAGLVAGMTAEDARQWIASRYVGAGQAGTEPDRQLLAYSVFDHAAVFFAAEGGEVYMYADPTRIPGHVTAAARRIAADTDHDDPLWEIAASLVAGEPAEFGSVADGEEFAGEFPPVVVLDGDPGSLSAQLREAVPIIHNRLWDLPRDPSEAGPWRLTDGFEIGSPLAGRRPVSDHFRIDTWLERMSDSGQLVISSPFCAYGQGGDWCRVRRSVLAAAKVIEDEANRVAPRFLQGRIGVEVLPVSVWGPEDRRIRVTFTGPDGERRDLRVVGAGTARWAVAAVQLACRRLANGHQVVTGQDGAVISDLAAARNAVQAARQEPGSQAAVQLEPADAPGVYIIDEPEAHLHPAAITSVRSWIEDLARTATAVLAATHSPLLLDTDSPLTTRVLVLPGTGLRVMAGMLDEQLAETVAELGITKGDLLLMTRLALFVEGPHDQIILTELFGRELRDTGIRVFPAHGGDEFQELVTTRPGLVGSEIVAALGIRLAVLSDSSPIRVEPVIKRMLREAKEQGREITHEQLSQEDILFYLDDQVCREAAPAFPGWRAARDAARAAERRRDRTARKWKRWVTGTYGLELSRDSIRELAAECRRQGRIPPELALVVSELTALAAASRQGELTRIYKRDSELSILGITAHDHR
jgi:AAA domain, putative AbiEii toxin, Type IV TA system